MDRNRQQREDDQWMTDGPSFDSGAGADPDLAGVEPEPETAASDAVPRDDETGVPLI